MRAPLLLATLIVLSTVSALPVAAADPCERDPVTQQSPCDWDCGLDPRYCRILAIVLFPCSQPGIYCP